MIDPVLAGDTCQFSPAPGANPVQDGSPAPSDVHRQAAATLGAALAKAAAGGARGLVDSGLLPALTDVLARAAAGIGDGVETARLIRQQLRVALAAHPARPVERWIVPAGPADDTAAHLIAVHLAARGLGARVWPWRSPPPGPAMVVSTAWLELLAADSY